MVRWQCTRCGNDHQKHEKCTRNSPGAEPKVRSKTKYDCTICGKRHPTNVACSKKPKPRPGYVRPKYHGLYSQSWWRRVRIQILNDNPFCKTCDGPATEVDHIVPHKGDEALFYDEKNLQTLCKKCHSIKTNSEMRNQAIDRRNAN